MKIRYFPDTDTPFIEQADRVSSSSEAVSDGQRRSLPGVNYVGGRVA